MGQVERNSLSQIVLPRPDRLSRQAINEVDAESLEPRPAQTADGGKGLCRGMAATQETQILVGEALHAHAHAVDGKRGQCRGIVGRDVVGVGLEGYLAATAEIDVAPQCLEKPPPQPRGELRRGTAPDIKSLNRFATQLIAPQLPLGKQRIDITCLHLLPHGGVEIAIDATGATKGNMQIKSGHDETGIKIRKITDISTSGRAEVTKKLFCNTFYKLLIRIIFSILRFVIAKKNAIPERTHFLPLNLIFYESVSIQRNQKHCPLG